MTLIDRGICRALLKRLESAGCVVIVHAGHKHKPRSIRVVDPWVPERKVQLMEDHSLSHQSEPETALLAIGESHAPAHGESHAPAIRSDSNSKPNSTSTRALPPELEKSIQIFAERTAAEEHADRFLQTFRNEVIPHYSEKLQDTDRLTNVVWRWSLKAYSGDPITSICNWLDQALATRSHTGYNEQHQHERGTNGQRKGQWGSTPMWDGVAPKPERSQEERDRAVDDFVDTQPSYAATATG